MAETLEERKKRHHQEDLQRLRGFRPIDDTFMRCLFRNSRNGAAHYNREERFTVGFL